MTNHWIDLKNADCILMMGANPAENHPVAMRWVAQARQTGASIISVDPRFTRSSAVADFHAPLRCGTDLALLGGMIKYILDGRPDGGDRIHREYVVNYTNASFLIDDRFGFDAAAGVFTGYDPRTRTYDRSTWQYQQTDPTRDPTLSHPRCVYQLLKAHYARYDLATVSRVTGTPQSDLKRIYQTFAATGDPGKAGTIMYAMGWTQHTVGTQTIRAMAIIQLLLGNIGRAGGGVNALRGESNVQGSTDHGLLFHAWPGYLKAPTASQSNLADYHAAHTPEPIGPDGANWWKHYPKYSVSLLKSTFGEAATPDNDFGFRWLPRRDDGVDYSWLSLFDAMHQGQIKGLFAWGQNPAGSGANAAKVRGALGRLDWLVSVNLFPNETASFWEDPGEELSPEQIATEVFLLPAAASLEKEGSVTNSGRWAQWRYRAADPPGDAIPDAQIMNLIFRELRKLYQEEGGPAPEAILNLKWDYFDQRGRLDPQAVAKEINGRFLVDKTVDGRTYRAGQLVPGFTALADDGSTSSGNWLYCGSFVDRSDERGTGNRLARRDRRQTPQQAAIGLFPNWAWCWPANRRILYNRASVDARGRPFDATKPVIAWRSGEGGWVGDVPDGAWPPIHVAADSRGYPFIMTPEGRARLFASSLADGPLPEHYEPLESPLEYNPLNGQSVNPAVRLFSGEADPVATSGGAAFPYVCTTYRVSEHWQTGVVSRHTPWLLETQPQLFVELSRELAEEKGIEPGDRVWVRSRRGSLMAFALPTSRIRPLPVQGRTVHQIGLPFCFGWKQPGKTGGDSANLLTPGVGDANTMIPETKAFLVNIEKAKPDDAPFGQLIARRS